MWTAVCVVTTQSAKDTAGDAAKEQDEADRDPETKEEDVVSMLMECVCNNVYMACGVRHNFLIRGGARGGGGVRGDDVCT